MEKHAWRMGGGSRNQRPGRARSLPERSSAGASREDRKEASLHNQHLWPLTQKEFVLPPGGGASRMFLSHVRPWADSHLLPPPTLTLRACTRQSRNEYPPDVSFNKS